MYELPYKTMATIRQSTAKICVQGTEKKPVEKGFVAVILRSFNVVLISFWGISKKVLNSYWA